MAGTTSVDQGQSQINNADKLVTTAERLALAVYDGLRVFDITLQKGYIYQGGAWKVYV